MQINLQVPNHSVEIHASKKFEKNCSVDKRCLVNDFTLLLQIVNVVKYIL